MAGLPNANVDTLLFSFLLLLVLVICLVTALGNLCVVRSHAVKRLHQLNLKTKVISWLFFV